MMAKASASRSLRSGRLDRGAALLTMMFLHVAAAEAGRLDSLDDRGPEAP